ncbi:MAG: 4Fe-4S binding protein [Candidatus Bathyarchaeota archaeon]|nr:4Fe-4S binding protein [Candidatus Bathyarchaeota archaeon]
MYSGLGLAGLLVLFIWIKNRTHKISYLRIYTQILSFVVIFSAMILIAQWNALVLGIIILVLPLFFGRFFCGWLCPFGLYMDLITSLRKALKIRYWLFPEKLNKALHKIRYVLAAWVLTLPLFFGALDPKTWSAFFQFQDPFKPLIIYFLGPLETLLIPWPGDIGFGDYSLSYPYIRGFTQYFPESILVTIAVVAFIAITAGGAFMTRRFWCRFCPTGVSIAALNRFSAFKALPLLHLNKAEEKCTKCGICKRVCPVQVTEVYEQKGGDIKTSMCLNCMRCLEMCPYQDCLTLKFAGKTLLKSRNWLEPSKIE